ncbi:hypothetical protein FO519_010506 [Halicephalobus sp. NKZ332]|nr:hypothetical protein FO519_010506 [Halicephalobus sp. NKZ332]
MFSLYSILEFTLLILNGFAIVNKERVLNKYLRNNQHSFHQSNDESVVMRLVNLILSIQTVLRIPLIGINVVVIVFKLLLG